MTYRHFFRIICVILEVLSVSAQTAVVPPATKGAVVADVADENLQEAYILRPRDTLLIKVLNEDELGTLPYPIELRGSINVPMVGRIHAAGMSLEQREETLTDRFREHLQDPIVTVTVAEFTPPPSSLTGLAERDAILERIHNDYTTALERERRDLAPPEFSAPCRTW